VNSSIQTAVISFPLLQSTVYYSTVYQTNFTYPTNIKQHNHQHTIIILWNTIISTHCPITKLSLSSSPSYSQHFNNLINKHQRSIHRNFHLAPKNTTNSCTNSYYNHPCLKPSTN
jgi:hypothetical protein